MDANDLARWTRFATKGGIGICTALQDCVAQGAEDLMFLKGDEVVVLLQLSKEDQYLGYCEGVVGRFHGSAVRFHGKLKKPVFAKRQSAVGVSPSRPLSLSPRSPSTNSPGSWSPSTSKNPSSPTFSPRVRVSSSDARAFQPARTSVSSVSPPSIRHRGPPHSRTASIASSSSHYSTHSRPPSSPLESVSHDIRDCTVSTILTQNAAPPGSESGSEDTQHVSLPVRPPSAQASATAAPVLTDGSAAQSPFLLTPTLALSPSSTGTDLASASLFRGRVRSGSEQRSLQEDTRSIKRRSGSEDSAIQAQYAARNQWSVNGGDAVQRIVPQETLHGEAMEFRAAESGTSFESVSVYSEVSVVHAAEKMTPAVLTKHLMRGGDGGILLEDESEEDSSRGGDRATSVSVLSELSDGGFGIGMTLLREDDDDEGSEDSGNDDREDDETAIGHNAPAQKSEDNHRILRTLRMVGARVMNPGSESPSTSEDGSPNEEAQDDTLMPQFPFQPQSASALALTSTASDFPASSAETAFSKPALPERSPLTSLSSSSTIASHRPSSVALTEDEHWESDADIYDDYRYSRYSSHSPAQHNSNRASRASTKSARSRASERPPLPDEEAWRRGGEESTPSRKSEVSERSGSTQDLGIETGSRGPSVSFSKHQTPAVRGAEVPMNKAALGGAASSTLPPHTAEMSESVTMGVKSLDGSMTSPLTRAFRESDGSLYSRQSHESDKDSVAKGGETSVLSNARGSSPGPEHKIEFDQPARSKSPALASSLREKIQYEFLSRNPKLSSVSPLKPQSSVLTSRPEDEPGAIVLDESSKNNGPPSPASPATNHLRVASPQSNIGSTPPSPLNPSFPPSPSTMTSFAATAPLNINKSPSPSPSIPRHPVSQPAIPFVGVPPPGRPPTHMQRAQQQPYHSQFSNSSPGQVLLSPSESLYSALRLAGQQRASTIHGHVQKDLLSATGPVPISFLLPGMQPPQSSPGTHVQPQPATPQPPYGQFPPQNKYRTQVPSLVPESQPRMTSLSKQQYPPAIVAPPLGQQQIVVPESPLGDTGHIGVPIPPSSNTPSPAAHQTSFQDVQHDARSAEQPPSSSVAVPLPRANFFPKVGQVRPRSRSFSGFNSEITERISQSLGRRSQEEGNQPLRASTSIFRPSFLSSRAPIQPLAPSPIMAPTRGKTLQGSRPAHGPSPLSLPPTTHKNLNSPFTAHAVVPSSPVPRVMPSLVSSPDNQDPHMKWSTLGQMPSHTSLHQTQTTGPTPSSVTYPPLQTRNSGLSSTSLTRDSGSFSLKPPSPFKSPTAVRHSHESDRTQTSLTPSEISTPSPTIPSSSSLVQSGPLRSKISLPGMRAKGAPRGIRDGASDIASSINGPATPTDEDTVQIKDLEFELVRPVFVHGLSDLHHNGGDIDLEAITTRTSDLHTDSVNLGFVAPNLGELSSSTDVRLGAISTSPETNPRRGKVAEVNSSVQAHRDRELKWVSTINSGDAAQARKSKKIKKLLIDGVPSSVRYLVWSHLSNSGSKKMASVYTQLSKRRPAFASDIERDVEQSFPDHQHLRDPNGPLVSVLFAYIAMVPDLHYRKGLAIIAGNLLLQSPEEDAFWTFLAMMDSHLRPYFMPTSPQMGVDTSLFVKTVEAADPQLAKRVFAELSVRPQDLCEMWFSSVFAGTLPLGHLHRVWDLFFYDGVPFLFRVGLTILSLSRPHLLESPKASPASYTAYLLRPPPEVLLIDPEQFISQALSVKLKDDDLRKTRLKMTDAAFKRQRGPRMSTSQPSHPHPQGQVEKVWTS